MKHAAHAAKSDYNLLPAVMGNGRGRYASVKAEEESTYSREDGHSKGVEGIAACHVGTG